MNAPDSYCDTHPNPLWLQHISNLQQDLWKAHSQIAELQSGITMYHNLLTDCYFKLYSKQCEITVQANEFETIITISR